MSKWMPNHKSSGFRHMLSSPQMDVAVRSVAGKVAARYRSMAPVETGSLKGSVKVSTERGGNRHDRRVGVVDVASPHAAAVELGNRRNGGRGQHVLRRALGGG